MTTEQRTTLICLVQLGKIPTEAFRLRQDVYGDDNIESSGLRVAQEVLGGKRGCAR